MDNINIQVKVKYITLIVSLLLTLIVSTVYYINEKNFELTLAIIGAGIALTAVIYSAINTNLIYHIESEKFKNEKRKISMDFIEKWSNPEMSKLNSKASYALIKIQSLNNEELKKYLTENQDKQMAILNLLNLFENISIAVNNNIADEDILKSFYKEIFCPSYSQLKNIISITRQQERNQNCWSEFETIIKKWQ